MKRIVEPEVMDGEEQAEAYALADFEEAHNSYIKKYNELFPDHNKGFFVDLGCGPGDVVFRFLEHFPDMEFLGVDASHPMLELATKDARYANVAKRVRFRECMLDNLLHSIEKYEGITSSSLLHHLHDPDILWKTISHLAIPSKTVVFVADLLRPNSIEEAKNIVETYAKNEAEILRVDFYNSLLAAFSIEEIKEQLQKNNITGLKVEQISNRHVIISGIIS